MAAISHSGAGERLQGMEPFEAVVRRHGLAVLRVCRATLDVHDADDAWSETFLSALEAYPRLSPGTNVEAWLVTIAKRKCVDIIRLRLRAPIPVAEVPLEPLVLADDRGEVWDAVAALPTRQRLSVAYHHLLGFPHAETAELIGGTPAAVRRAASDGLAALRVALGAHPSPLANGDDHD